MFDPVKVRFRSVSTMFGPISLMLLALTLALLCRSAEAGPWPAQARVEPWDDLNGAFLAPSSPDPMPASVVRVNYRNSANVPVEGATVVVTFQGDGFELCEGSVLSVLTDAEGNAELPIYGSGCASGVPLSCVMKANGVTIRAYENFKSPDFDGQVSNGVVDLADLLEFKRGFLDGNSDCHDYNDDGAVGLSDLLLFGPAFVRGLSCP